MRTFVVSAVVVLILAAGMCGALSAGDAGTAGSAAPEAAGGDPPEPAAKASRARAAVRDDALDAATPAAAAAAPAKDPDVTPDAPGEATSDGFPPFTFQGGPLLVRSSPTGTAVLDPAAPDLWRPLLRPDGTHIQGILGPGLLLTAVTHCQSGQSAEAHGWPTALEIARTAHGGFTAAVRDRNVSFVAVRGGSVIAIDVRERRLLRIDVGADGTPRTTDLPALGDVDRVVALTGTCAFVATRGDERLVRVPFDGSPARRLAVREADGKLVPSPDGRLVAVVSSMPWRLQDDEHRTPALRIVDGDDDRETLRVEHIDISVSPLSSGIPQLEVAWADGRRIRWSESVAAAEPADGSDAEPADGTASADDAATRRILGGGHRWVEVDVLTGERLAAVSYSDRFGIYHQVPPTAPVLAAPGPADRTGRFAIRGDEIFFEGAVERPAARATWAPGAISGQFIGVSPDGRFAVVCVTEEKRRLVVLLDAETRTRRVVHRGADTPQTCGAGDTHFSWLAAP